MLSMLRASLIAAAMLIALALPTRAQAPDPVPADLNNSMIRVAYMPSQKYAQMRLELREKKILERLKQFLSPLRLPQTLGLRMEQCDDVNMFYRSLDSTITVCYEFIEVAQKIADFAATQGAPRDVVLYGGIIGGMLHEAGHAVFDILRVPVLGREEDAADQIASFIALQFQPEIAKVVIQGTAHMLRLLGGADVDKANLRAIMVADEHGTASQRFYNIFCIAYGADPKTYREIAEVTKIPAERLRNCANEYREVEAAFAKTVYPYVDQEKMAKVQAVHWLDVLGFKK